MAIDREGKTRQGEERFSKFRSIVTRLWYWFKMPSEGRTVKDKLILLPGTFLRLGGFAIGSCKTPSVNVFFRCISAPKFHVTIDNRDGKFLCRKATDDAEHAAEVSEYGLRRYFEEIEQGTFVDVGAHIGKYTIRVARQLGNKGSVISVEPENSNFEMLKANVELNDLSNVTLLNVCCWSKGERLRLYSPSSSVLKGGHSVKNPMSTDFVEVDALKLDDILKDLQTEHVAFVKVDAEGADGEVLEGAEETLATNPDLKIIFEARDEDNLAKCQQVLRKHGFTTVPIANVRYCYVGLGPAAHESPGAESTAKR